MSRAGAVDVERRAADRGQPLDPGREIALVRARHQPLAQPERAHQLRAARQQRGDPRRAPRRARSSLRDPAGAARRRSLRAARARARAARAPRSLSPGRRISTFTPPIIVRPCTRSSGASGSGLAGARLTSANPPMIAEPCICTASPGGTTMLMPPITAVTSMSTTPGGKRASRRSRLAPPNIATMLHPARHRPGPAPIDAAEDRVQRVAVRARRAAAPATTVGTTAGTGAAAPAIVGQVGEQRLDVGRVVGRLRDGDPALELVDVQRVVREVVGQARDHALARLLRAPDQRAVRRGQAGRRGRSSVVTARECSAGTHVGEGGPVWASEGMPLASDRAVCVTLVGLAPGLPIGLSALLALARAAVRAGRRTASPFASSSTRPRAAPASTRSTPACSRA